MLKPSSSHPDPERTFGRSAGAATRASKTRVGPGFLRCQIRFKLLDQILLVGVAESEVELHVGTVGD